MTNQVINSTHQQLMGKGGLPLFHKVMLRSCQRPKRGGRLTEDFEQRGSLSDPGWASGDLAVEVQLIGGLDIGDGQGEVLSDGDTSGQGGVVIALSLATLGESHALPVSLLVLDVQEI